MKSLFTFLAFAFFVMVAFLFGSSCANIIPPAGGPRDTIPPRLVTAAPRDSTLNFRGDRIELNFDEYIDLQDVQNNLLFTPLFENNPVVEARSRTITVRFRDTLDPNTTYILNFGSAIRDFNEGNVLKNFVYTFSTGPALDTLELAGRVQLAQTGGTDSTLIVVLHRSLEDSAVMLQRPQYVTRLDAQGNFRFRNLPKGRFAIYAMSDQGGSRRYQNKTQLFAFADRPVTPGDSALTLYAYRETATPNLSLGNPLTRTSGNTAANRLIFSTNLENNIQDLQKPLVVSFGTPIRNLDTTRIQLSTDSTFQRQRFTTQLDSTRRELTIRTAWKPGAPYSLILDRDFAQDTSGRRLLKTDTVFFVTKREADYANISVRMKGIDLSRNPVLLFIQNDQVVHSASIQSGSYRQTRFVPGEYQLRVLYDTNNNGKWDPGTFFGPNKRQPELVVPIPQGITVKADWDNDFER